MLLKRFAVSGFIFTASCGGTSTGVDPGADASVVASDSGAPTANGACQACVTDGDCSGGVCAQFGGDAYCAPTCPSGNECSSDQSCTTLSTASGEQVNVCVPRTDACGANVGPGSGAPSDAGGNPGVCGTLSGPSVAADCASCGSHTCQPNGCYGGWWCNTATKKCQSAPANCTGNGSGNGPGGGGASGSFDGGAPVSGSVGATGGTVSRLYFGIVGDTRPATIDDTAGYPSAVINGIFGAIQTLSPSPPFVVSTGDYQFSAANGTASGPQFDLYLAGRSKYAGAWFPTMGNHECTGMTASNCGAGNKDGLPANYKNYLSKLLGPIQKTDPYYAININAADGAWTSKFVFIAANAWSSSQATWLQSVLAQPTTYTFVIRHEPAAASTAPGVTPSEQIMAQHPYTLALTGHTHTYAKSGHKQIIVGNGGAPLSGSATYGYGIVSQRGDGAVQIDMIDYATGQADLAFRFAVMPDGSAAP